MTDSKYFTTTKKGEIFELKSELNNDKKEKKKEAVKKVRRFIIEMLTILSVWSLISHWHLSDSALVPPVAIDCVSDTFVFVSRSLPAWLSAKMYPRCFQMLSTACKRTIWNWRNWSIYIWWIMPNHSRTWPLWLLTHLLRLVHSSVFEFTWLHQSFTIFYLTNLSFFRISNWNTTIFFPFIFVVCSFSIQSLSRLSNKSLSFLLKRTRLSIFGRWNDNIFPLFGFIIAYNWTMKVIIFFLFEDDD